MLGLGEDPARLRTQADLPSTDLAAVDEPGADLPSDAADSRHLQHPIQAHWCRSSNLYRSRQPRLPIAIIESSALPAASRK